MLRPAVRLLREALELPVRVARLERAFAELDARTATPLAPPRRRPGTPLELFERAAPRSPH